MWESRFVFGICACFLIAAVFIKCNKLLTWLRSFAYAPLKIMDKKIICIGKKRISSNGEIHPKSDLIIWLTIIPVALEQKFTFVPVTKRQYEVHYQMADRGENVYYLPPSTMYRKCRLHYQYDVHLRLLTHDPPETLSVHNGRKPRIRIMGTCTHLNSDLLNLILDHLCEQHKIKKTRNLRLVTNSNCQES
jgi:hypothetical protein